MPTISIPSTSRRQVAIMGKVVDGRTQGVVRGAEVRVTAMPPAFDAWLAARALRFGSGWGALTERPDVTRTRDDGTFALMDLPDGSYTITVSTPGEDHRYGTAQKTYTVSRTASGVIVAQTSPPGPLIGSISLPPTGAAGTVLCFSPPSSTAPLFMARVAVRGSGEHTYTDPTGAYYLTGVELGGRIVEVSAPGYIAGTTTITLQKGVVQSDNNLILYPNS